MSIIDDFLADTREHMNKSVDATRSKFGSGACTEAIWLSGVGVP